MERRRDELRDEFASFFLAFLCSRSPKPIYHVEVDGVISKFVLIQPDVPVEEIDGFLRTRIWSSDLLEKATEQDLRLFVEAHPYIRHEYIIAGGEGQTDGSYSFHFVCIKRQFNSFANGFLKHITPRYHYLARVRR
ncbi:MAG: hypothetical protein KW804_00985 [Candidatus Doudnabacteria bacterium]|nr:hypothetical protein [Candidatus Doudnabacteria bacterium]